MWRACNKLQHLYLSNDKNDGRRRRLTSPAESSGHGGGAVGEWPEPTNQR